MTIPTSAEQLLLDTEPQQTDLYLSIYEPDLAMICQVTGSYSQDDQTVDYYNPVSGTYANIVDYRFQVALIGISANDDSLGRTWVRSATATTLRFVESDHIDWDSATYITILKYTEIIPVFPRIIQNPADEENVIFYKIWDIAYTNQNSILGTFINMGSNYAGFLDNGTGTCYWSASGSSNLLGEAVSYLWTFEGGNPSTSTVCTPGYVYYTATGHHRTILQTTTTGTAAIDTSIRYVSFYDRPGAGNNTPILNWELLNISGHRDTIGYTCQIRVYETLSRTRLRDGMLIVIFGEDYYGSTKQNINNRQTGRSNIKFIGYIAGGTIQYNYADKWVEFECFSPTNFMELCECFSCSVESKISPSTWYELLNMDLRRAIYHYLRWQSSVLLCCDVSFTNFTDRNIQYFDADRTSLYDAVNSLIDSARIGKLVSDVLGKLWFEQEVSVIDGVSAAFSNALSINKKDWMNEPIIDERHFQECSYIERGGIQYDYATNKFAALLSGAPGISPAYRGQADEKQGLALGSQTELNTMTGNLYAYINSRYPNSELQMRANINNIDIAPQEKVSWTVAAGDTSRNITFTNKAFAIRGKSWSWNAKEKRIAFITLNLAEITQGYPGDTILIPVEPPVVVITEPPVSPPPIPPPPINPPPPPVSSVDAVVTQNDDVRTSDDLDQVSPTWDTEI